MGMARLDKCTVQQLFFLWLASFIPTTLCSSMLLSLWSAPVPGGREGAPDARAMAVDWENYKAPVLLVTELIPIPNSYSTAWSSRLGTKGTLGAAMLNAAVSVPCVSWDSLSASVQCPLYCTAGQGQSVAVMPTWPPDWPNFLLPAVFPWDKAVAVFCWVCHNSFFSLPPHPTCPQ